MNKTLDDLYLEWLYGQVGSVKQRNPSRTYWSLLRQLFCKEFVWFIPNDDNRVEDGRDLRYQFKDQNAIYDIDSSWMGLGCSMLEMLIGLSRRLSFEGEGAAEDWFWELINNLGINFNDVNYKVPGRESEIDEILDTVIWRTYKRSGEGGLFPLRRSTQDQRNVEIWYQLSAYLNERL